MTQAQQLPHLPETIEEQQENAPDDDHRVRGEDGQIMVYSC